MISMPHRKKSKAAKDQQSSRSSTSPLARAFDHCPVVLFSFISDNEAARVARALCIPHFLPNKHYVMKRAVCLAKLLSGVYSCPANNVWLNEVPTVDQLAQCPSTVKSMALHIFAWPDFLHLKAKQLPRSLTRLKVSPPVRWLISDVDWPPLLSSLSWSHSVEPGSELPVVPSSLRILRLMGVLSKLELPSSLQELDLSDSDFNSPLSHPTLPKVTFSASFNQPISARDLPSLRELSVGSAFNHPLDDLPASLTKLILRGDYTRRPYDHTLDHLPASLKRLELGRPYDLLLDRLPTNLSSLLISFDFNQPLDHLPDALTELDLQSAHHFNQPLDYLPQQLQVLMIGKVFNQPLYKLPSGLTYLDFYWTSCYPRSLDRLPSSLHTLIMPDGYNQSLNRLPPSLKILNFFSDSRFNQPLDQLPDSLSILRLGDSFNQPFSRLPRALTVLDLGDSFNQPLFRAPLLLAPEALDSSGRMTRSRAAAIGCLQADVTSHPLALRVLELGLSFNQPLYLPPSLTELVFRESGCFSHPLPASSREQLVKLELPKRYRL